MTKTKFRLFSILLFFILALPMVASGRPSGGDVPEVAVLVGDSAYELKAVPTQVLLHKGWSVFGLNVNRYMQRILPGRQSRQMCDSSRPVLIIQPSGATLYDYALIRLTTKKDFRLFPKLDFADNPLVRFNLSEWLISLTPDEAFRLQPTSDLPAGEYVVINTKSAPLDSEGNFPTWSFTIK